MTDTLKKKLFRALEKSDINMLRAVLKQGASVVYEEDDHISAFHEAINCGRNDIEILEELLAHGADINARDKHGGSTPLQWVVWRPQTQILHWFLKNGAAINVQDDKGWTPLIDLIKVPSNQDEDADEAFRLNNIVVLLNAGADLHLADIEGNTALHWAATLGLAQIVLLLLERGARINAKAKDGNTPLHLAVKNGKREVAEVLLKNGANQNMQDDHGNTPLHVLAEKYPKIIAPDDHAIAELLINAAAAVDLPDKWGCTALCLAAGDGNEEIGLMLVARGADVNANNGYALRDAVFFEHDEFVEFLLKHGAKPNLGELEISGNALHIAASEGYMFGTKILLQHGANIELVNIDGETALCIASRRYNDEVAEYLISQGANVNHVDSYGNTPMFLAKRRENEELVTMLLTAGVKQ